MYVPLLSGLGTEMRVAPADESAARSKVASIVADNAKKQAKYAADLVAYRNALASAQAVQADNDKLTLAYTNAQKSYALAASSVDASNKSTLMGYTQLHAEWADRKSAYDRVASARQGIVSSQAAQTAKVLSQAGSLPPGYTGCITQAERTSYTAACNRKMQQASSVRGFGFLGEAPPGALECYWKDLPLCQTLPALPAAPGPEPQKPAVMKLPPAPTAPKLKKVPTVPMKPLVPILTSVPDVVVDPSLAPQRRALAVGGILALVLVGGGAAYYLTRPKKKAAA